MAIGDWRRYLAPAAFLLAATIAVVLIRAGLESGGGPSSPAGTPTLVSTRSTTTRTAATTVRKHKRTAAKRFWTVQAGDTFAVVASKTGVPVATIERLNPTVKSTSLFIGEKLRIR